MNVGDQVWSIESGHELGYSLDLCSRLQFRVLSIIKSPGLKSSSSSLCLFAWCACAILAIIRLSLASEMCVTRVMIVRALMCSFEGFGPGYSGAFH